jgi:hypothetical protein
VASGSFAGIEHPSGLANGYDGNGKRSAVMLRGVALPSRAGVIVNLCSALMTLVGLERQAFNLGEEEDGNDRAPDVAVTDDRRKVALALLLASENHNGPVSAARTMGDARG